MPCPQELFQHSCNGIKVSKFLANWNKKERNKKGSFPSYRENVECTRRKETRSFLLSQQRNLWYRVYKPLYMCFNQPSKHFCMLKWQPLGPAWIDSNETLHVHQTWNSTQAKASAAPGLGLGAHFKCFKQKCALQTTEEPFTRSKDQATSGTKF